MSIAIVIGTHGSAAEQLLKTSEMILGAQKNVAWIDFIPGENTETLIKKYATCLEHLDTTAGVLFLVDTWGGSPFNAASQIVIDKDNYEVVTGVNIPMLTETFMARDDNQSFQNLVCTAVETGRIGVKVLKATEQKQVELVTAAVPIAASDLSNHINNGVHMNISLARIDDRLIHGQVVTCWTKATNITRIIVVSDEVAANTLRKNLLTQVAPPGVTSHVVDVAKAIRVYNNPKYANDRVMLLFTNPTDVLRLVEGGVVITSVNIGGMAFRHGKKQVNNAVSVDAKDIEAFKKLNERGIKLEVRKVASDYPLQLRDLLKKLDK
ncbi:PTS system mannose-specific EIIAB component [Candidatus Moranella endobia PCVAL]|uniref:PTS system mannose-specific EIIAB component n=1 Tax=Moranella endobia (strain PCIT) TaxID=903503 RepID=F7XXI7_MOREP|nr:PTS mannose transporter subunit IIAB [Candidatus Moranella endobia]AEI74813.1 putative PTS system, mannose/sorbose family, IIAB component [Candidatus Moranella endobia PCIT]AGJ61470.1 PTS system mannose-specific EIIAB component [Candidatus Moranella endobia PCVAL]